MLNLWKSFKGKLLTDRADSILVPALILAPVIALTLGIAVEVGKNNYIRTERVNAIQDAASSAVSLTDNQGSLSWSVVEKIVNQYEHIRFGKKTFSSSSDTGIDGPVRDTANGIAIGDSSTGADSCLVGRGDESGARYPQYKITLDTGRGGEGFAGSNPATVNFSRTQPSLDTLNSMAPLGGPQRVDNNGKPLVYRSVTVEVIDQTPNIVMGLMGAPCQKFVLTASSVTFSADSDLL